MFCVFLGVLLVTIEHRVMSHPGGETVSPEIKCAVYKLCNALLTKIDPLHNAKRSILLAIFTIEKTLPPTWVWYLCHGRIETSYVFACW